MNNLCIGENVELTLEGISDIWRARGEVLDIRYTSGKGKSNSQIYEIVLLSDNETISLHPHEIIDIIIL